MRRPTSAQSQDCAARTCSGHRRRLAMKKLSRMSSTLTIGLDLGDVWSDWVAIDADGVVAARERVRRSGALLRTRDGLVATPTKLIKPVRGASKSFGVALPKCSSESFATRARASVPKVAAALAMVLDQISTLTEQVRELDRSIDAMLKRHPAARRLTQITGVGALTALAYVLTIED